MVVRWITDTGCIFIQALSETKRARIQFTTPTGRVGSINRVVTHND